MTFDFFMTNFISLFSCFIYYICLIPVIFIIIYTLFICTSTFFFLTHSLGCFLTTLDLHVQVLDISCYWSSVRLRPNMLRGAGVFLYPFWYYCLSFYSYWFCSFPDLLYFAISYYSFPYSYVIMVMLICDITVIMIHFSKFYSLFRLL